MTSPLPFPPPSSMTATFLLFVVALVLPPGDSQTWETSNDPDGLCTTAAGAKVTGYKATLDCRGYVYCADGYLMGGGAAGASPSGVSGGTGVIACWPNQLFDEASGTCRGWQDVDTSRCPRFDGSMMMPEDTDENANQERFFCGVSASNAKRVCESCPGGSRLECSDPTHNCFAGINCSNSNNSNSSPNPWNSGKNPPPSPPALERPDNPPPTRFPTKFPTPRPQTRFPTRLPTPLPSPFPTNRPVAFVAQNSDSNASPAAAVTAATSVANPNDGGDGVFLHGILRSSYYCGWSWAVMLRTCDVATPCPSGLSNDCPTGQTCFPDTPCASLRTPPPTATATLAPVTREARTYYCGYSWDWVVNNCPRAVPCPHGDALGICPSGMRCIADTPCWALNNGMPTRKPTPFPTRGRTIPPFPVVSQETQTFYCGYDWDWVVNNCARAVPCPGGDASGVCPLGHRCIADTPCWALNNGMPTKKPTRFPSRGPTSPPVEKDDPGKRFCGYDWASVTENCLTAVPCPGGYAEGVCPYQMNCIAETLCSDESYLDWLRAEQASNGSGQQQPPVVAENNKPNSGFVVTAPSPPTVATTPAQDSHKEETDQQPQQEVNVGSREPVLTPHQNPKGNVFFCAAVFDDITTNCLRSKPCPGGFSSVCANDEGCFSSLECAAVYESATTIANNGPPPSLPPTPNPSRQPSRPPTQKPTLNPISKPKIIPNSSSNASNSSPSSNRGEEPNVDKNQPAASVNTLATLGPSKDPVTPLPSKAPTVNTNFCGISWAEHIKDCVNSTPCPNGSECPSGERCFNDSPCALPQDVSESSVGSFCGTEWNLLMSTCKSATKCPHGDECAEGEFCYQGFHCNPQLDATAAIASTAAPTVTPLRTPLPSRAPITPQPSKAPIINTNFCGISWAEHARDCANSIPCPTGSECAPGERCFNDSPCALQGDVSESNIGNFCGTEWSSLMSTCKSAKKCPHGDECSEGEFCYQGFHCNPELDATATITSTAAPITTSSRTPLPSRAPVTPPPSNAPIINTNFCGISWAEHAKDCPNSRPCPTGSECAQGERCFNDSPCALPDDVSESNIKSFCGTEWNLLISTCNLATRCPNGNECAEGEFCYQDFHCDSDQLPSALAPTSNTESSNGSSSTGSNLLTPPNDNGNSFSHGSGVTNQNATSNTQSKPCSICDTEINWEERVTFEGNDISCGEFGWIFAEKILEGSDKCLGYRVMYMDKCCKRNQGPPISGQIVAESCNICGNSEINWEKRAEFEGNDISCGEFGWIFSEKVLEGSSKCLDYRSMYFDTCCKIKSTGTGCDICDTGISGYLSDVRDSLTVEFNDDDVSCADARNMISATFQSSNAQCTESKKTLAERCCFQRCSLCGDYNLDWEATVLLSGKEVPCHEVDDIFLKEEITVDSSRCEISRSFYADTCCIRPPEVPCNLCSLNGINVGKQPISNSRVSYNGEFKSCLEVYHSLYARREQFSKHCTDAQKELFDDCCEAVNSQGDAGEIALPPPTTSPTTQKPSPNFDTSSWYTAGLQRSPASMFTTFAWSFRLLVSAGLIILLLE